MATGSDAPKDTTSAVVPGLFEVATDGTLFLDEVGEIAPTLQAKLLRALD